MTSFRCTSNPIAVIVAGLFAWLTSVAPVIAIDIVLNFDSAASDSPSFDPTGALFQPLFEHAESFYEDVFQDTAANTTLTVNFWYDDVSGSTLGLHTLQNQTSIGGTLPNREIEADIQIDTRLSTGVERTWFIDPTPADDSEFSMQQTLWRNLSAFSKSDLFHDGSAGNIPDTFEAAYFGSALPGGAASGLRDMLTLVLHEVGHALGMSSSNTATVAETIDNDYDINPDFILGQSLAVQAADSGNIAHLDTSGNFLMDPGIPINLRRRPSHVDLFAMAAGHSYTSLDVPRREFYRPGAAGNWNDSANWIGGEVPESDDHISIRDNRPGGSGSLPTVQLTANGEASQVTVAEGAGLDVDGFQLVVAGALLVDGANSNLFIGSGGRVEADTLAVEDGAEVRFELTDTGHGQLDVNGTAELEGLMGIQAQVAYADPSLRGDYDEFIFITAGSVTGDFSTVEYNGDVLVPTFSEPDGSLRTHQGNGFFRNIQYDVTSLTFINLNALEGDADGDLDIDITDFDVLTSNFDDQGVNSATNNWTTGDFDADGDIDITDFNEIAKNFSAGGYAGLSGDPVPEPSTLLLVGMGSVLLGLFWPRQLKS